MALPHSLPTVQDIALADTSNPSGSAATCRMLLDGEPLEGFAINRPAYALFENDAYLYGVIGTDEIAYTEVGALTAFTGASIVIDPSGGAAGDVNYTGKLYLGDAAWLTGQEALDTLFQLLDEDGNEVLVDGVEVKITSLTGGSVGGGFLNSAVTLNLNKTLPSANYRIAYGRATTLENLPAYALIRADIRGLHEASGEAGRQSVYVLDPAASPTKPADFHGATCFQDALANVGDNVTLYLRAGTYTVHATSGSGTKLTVSNVGLKVIGEGEAGVTLQLQTGHDLDFDDATIGLHLEELTIDGDAGQDLNILSGSIHLEHVTITDLTLHLLTDVELDAEIINVECTGGVKVDTCTEDGVFDNCNFSSSNNAIPALAIGPSGAGGATKKLTFSNCNVDHSGDGDALYLYNATKLVFDNCEFASAGNGNALEYGDLTGSQRVEADFCNCDFSSDRAAVRPSGWSAQRARMLFRNCNFLNTATASYTSTDGFCGFLASDTNGKDVGFVLDNCYFRDYYHEGHTGALLGQPLVAMTMVTARRIRIDRSLTTSFWGNAAYLELNESLVEGLELNMGCQNAPSSTYPDDGFVKVLGSSTLRDVRVDGLGQNFPFPLFYLAGTEIVGASQYGEIATLDSVRVFTDSSLSTGDADCPRLGLPSGGGVYPSKPLIAELQAFSKLRRLTLTKNEFAYYTTASGSDYILGFVLLADRATTMEDCHIDVADDIAGLCIVGATSSSSYHGPVIIDRNYIKTEDTQAGFKGSIWASAWISTAGAGPTTVFRGLSITNNFIERDGPVTNTDTLINMWDIWPGSGTGDTGVQLAHIEGNKLLAETDGAGNDEFITMPDNELPALTNNCGGCNVIGNYLLDIGATGNPPTIEIPGGHSIPNSADNVFATVA